MNNIKKYREEQKLSLYDLERETGLRASYICALEKGVKTNPSKDAMDRIAEALEVTVQNIFYERGEVNCMNKQLEQRLSSREVADMMEIRHTHLLEKIDKINEDFRKTKIGLSKYWSESSYKADGNNKTYREFLITKRGCEFLAHKTTGTKGNIFTDKYMDRFEDMKNQLSIGESNQNKEVIEGLIDIGEEYSIEAVLTNLVSKLKKQEEAGRCKRRCETSINSKS